MFHTQWPLVNGGQEIDDFKLAKLVCLLRTCLKEIRHSQSQTTLDVLLWLYLKYYGNLCKVFEGIHCFDQVALFLWCHWCQLFSPARFARTSAVDWPWCSLGVNFTFTEVCTRKLDHYQKKQVGIFLVYKMIQLFSIVTLNDCWNKHIVFQCLSVGSSLDAPLVQIWSWLDVICVVWRHYWPYPEHTHMLRKYLQAQIEDFLVRPITTNIFALNTKMRHINLWLNNCGQHLYNIFLAFF